MVSLNPDYSPIFKINYSIEKNYAERDYQSGARIVRVSPHEFPNGVRGMYLPASHTILLPNDLVGKEFDFVKAHESGHAQGLHNEQATDNYAALQVGHSQRQLLLN